MITIGRLARACGLSRSTLLYYDSIALLRPSGRSASNYRLYTDADRRRLESICQLREAGLPLEAIREVLDAPSDRTSRILEEQLERLNRQIADLREQQRVVVRLLQRRETLWRARAMDKASWVALLRASGLDDAAMDRWHAEFERRTPDAHQDFLESLGIPPAEIAAIRAHYAPQRPTS